MFKKLTLIIITLLLGKKLFAQDQDSIQPDSVYVKYKISSRADSYKGSPSKSKQIFLFDRSGRYSGFILTDNETGKTPQMKMIYTYNAKGILASENDTSYRGSNYTVKNAEIFYAEDGTLLKKVVKNEGRIVSEISYYPVENKKVETLYRKGSVYRTQTSFYDNHNKEIRFTGTELGDKDAVPRVIELNGKKYTIPAQNKDEQWDYNFENIYDDAGRLVSKKRLIDGKVQDEIVYKYDERGLMTEKIEKRGNNEQIIQFEYTYY
ncbi:MAG TPA: hypothetical protein VGN20_18660 [Mucilaginibacter sp.]|jgi:hypothetical protein